MHQPCTNPKWAVHQPCTSLMVSWLGFDALVREWYFWVAAAQPVESQLWKKRRGDRMLLEHCQAASSKAAGLQSSIICLLIIIDYFLDSYTSSSSWWNGYLPIWHNIHLHLVIIVFFSLHKVTLRNVLTQVTSIILTSVIRLFFFFIVYNWYNWSSDHSEIPDS